jgi:hypothetical protein
MRITSTENISWVNIEYVKDSAGYPSFEIEVHADIQHGQFHAKNHKVQFQNFEEFVADLDRFILDRSRSPRLEGTYNTFIAFLARGNVVICQYRLGGAFCGRKTVYFHHFGEFEFNQEYLIQLLGSFRELMEAQHA